MESTPIFNSSLGRKMRVALFISGSGTNGVKIIEKSTEDEANFEVTLIFSDIRDTRIRRNGSKMSNAKDIAMKYDISYEYCDIRDFYKTKGVKRTDLSLRPEFDELVLKKLEGYKLDLIINAGYMSIMTPVFIDEYLGKIINVHPADLTVMDGADRKYVGIHVVEQAILEGDSSLKSTTHIVREEVDRGEILLLSPPIPVNLTVSLEELKKDKKQLKQVVTGHQNLLKEKGDWVILPETVQMISQGRFSLGKKGVYLDGKPVPDGFQLAP